MSPPPGSESNDIYVQITESYSSWWRGDDADDGIRWRHIIHSWRQQVKKKEKILHVQITQITASHTQSYSLTHDLTSPGKCLCINYKLTCAGSTFELTNQRCRKLSMKGKNMPESHSSIWKDIMTIIPILLLLVWKKLLSHLWRIDAIRVLSDKSVAGEIRSCISANVYKLSNTLNFVQ